MPAENAIIFAGEVEIDQLTVGAQTLARDPALRSVIEELRSIYLSQESVVQQASKALDECSNLKRKQSDSIIFAEQLLNVAWQRYTLAHVSSLLRISCQ